jgi:transposase
MYANGSHALFQSVLQACMIDRVEGESPLFPPEVALHAVKIACERPDVCGRSLSVWDCQEIARQLIKDAITPSISGESVRKMLAAHRLKPWRYRMWLSAKVPRDAAFRTAVERLCALYTRLLLAHERVICTDEITSLQPRPRLSPTLPALPELPVRVEHEYKRCGALNLLTAFDTRSGQVFGVTAERKRQIEFLQLLELLDAQIPESVTVIYLVLDNVPMHTGKKVQAWLLLHPRFVLVHPPVHCSWMNQVEQWFSILRRKRLKVVDFTDKTDLAAKLMAFIQEWNERAHAFHWTSKSFEKILQKCEQTFAMEA